MPRCLLGQGLIKSIDDVFVILQSVFWANYLENSALIHLVGVGREQEGRGVAPFYILYSYFLSLFSNIVALNQFGENTSQSVLSNDLCE